MFLASLLLTLLLSSGALLTDIEKSRYAEEVPWLLHSSHRNWCPRGLPDPECAVGRWIDIHRMPYKCQSLRDAEGCLYDARFMGYYD